MKKIPHTYNYIFFSLIKISMQKITIFLVHFCPPISLIEWVNHYFFKAAVNEIRKKFLKKCFCFLKNPKSCCTYENIPMLKYFSLKWLFQYYQKKKKKKLGVEISNCFLSTSSSSPIFGLLWLLRYHHIYVPCSVGHVFVRAFNKLYIFFSS